MRFGDLLLRRRRFVAIRGEQPGQQPALEVVEIHRLERLIRRVRRAAAGVVSPVGLDDLGDHRRQPLVEVREVFVVGEQVEQRRTHRLDVLGRQSLRPVLGVVVVEDDRLRARAPRGTTGRTSRRRSRGDRGGAAPRRRCPPAAPPGRPRPSTDITRPASTVSDGPTEIPCPRSASTNSTRWPGIPCGANGCGGRVRRTAISSA